MTFIDYFAWYILIVILATMVAELIGLGLAPGYIARNRNHPWANAVEVAGWVTLIFGFVLWPLALIWAVVDVPKKEGVK